MWSGSPVAVLDAPVLGSVPSVESGSLVILVGGDHVVFDRHTELLSLMGTPIYLGASGSGAWLKLVNNAASTATLVAIGELLALTDRAGLGIDDVLKGLGAGPLASLIERWRPAQGRGPVVVFPPRARPQGPRDRLRRGRGYGHRAYGRGGGRGTLRRGDRGRPGRRGLRRDRPVPAEVAPAGVRAPTILGVKSTRQRASEALRSDDFRRLFAIRLITQSGDGLFQAALVASIVFNPEEQNTILGFAIATLVVSLPFSILGPFTGVFIDRWSRRKILVVAPWLRAAAVWLVLFDPKTAPVLFFGGALWVLSVNRFYLATAQAVVPRMVPTEDLLMANSMATVGGTVALTGVFVGGWIADLFGNLPVIAFAGAEWIVASVVATRIRPAPPPPRARGPRARRAPARGARVRRWHHAAGAGSRPDHVDHAGPGGTGDRARALAVRVSPSVRGLARSRT